MLDRAGQPGAAGGRVLVAVGLAAYVAASYLLVVVGGGRLLHHRAPDVLLAVLATAVVALTFEEVRGYLRRRLVRTDQDLLLDFADTLSAALPVENIAPRMAQLLAAATGARRTEVWLVQPTADQGRALAARWPPDAPPIQTGGGTGSVDRTVHIDEVNQAGRRLGVVIREDGATSGSPVEDRLVRDLVGQAGVALRTVALTAELTDHIDRTAARAAELRASRQRIVDTGDAARRRLERDVHDGAQQHLVALAVNLSLAATVAARDRGRAVELVADLQPAAVAALATLEQLSRGIYPSLLARSGPAAALATVVRTSPVPVTVLDETSAGWPTDVAAAAYFTSLEAVQNAVKHAGAGRVDVRFGEADAALLVTVADDGDGFDDRAPAGAGLTGMRDRVESLGGRLTVRTAPGAGTTVTAVIPVAVVTGPAATAEGSTR